MTTKTAAAEEVSDPAVDRQELDDYHQPRMEAIARSRDEARLAEIFARVWFGAFTDETPIGRRVLDTTGVAEALPYAQAVMDDPDVVITFADAAPGEDCHGKFGPDGTPVSATT